ncbi:MAG: AraC family transcriptional regulator [Vallitaleaceae bacterium]|nr:AraC family transcriptional regulator [Vallitaleaceae bacterium]
MATNEFTTENNKQVQRDLIMYHFGEEVCEPSHHYGPAIRDHYLIHYVLSGKGTFSKGSEKYHLIEGMCFLIAPNEVTYYEADNADPWHYVWIGFNGMRAYELISLCGFSQNTPTLTYTLRQDHDLGDHIIQLLMNRNAFDSSELWLTGQLYVFLSQLVKNKEYGHNNQRLRSQAEQYVLKSVQFMKNNYSHQITIQNVADYIGLDRSYFYAIFKKKIGVSPKEYLVQIRMKKAKELLTSTTLSLNEIAYSTGYVDPFLFSKTIKKHTGLSPSAFRKTI